MSRLPAPKTAQSDAAAAFLLPVRGARVGAPLALGRSKGNKFHPTTLGTKTNRPRRPQTQETIVHAVCLAPSLRPSVGPPDADARARRPCPKCSWPVRPAQVSDRGIPSLRSPRPTQLCLSQVGNCPGAVERSGAQSTCGCGVGAPKSKEEEEEEVTTTLAR